MAETRYIPGSMASDLGRADLEDIVHRVQQLLWMDSGKWDPGKPWNPITTCQIASVLCEYNLIPMEDEDEEKPDPALFVKFLSTGRNVPDLGAVLKDEMLQGKTGRIYLDALYIEDTCSWPSDAPGFGKGRWYTLIGNCEYQHWDLEKIERILFDFAISEGYLQ